MPDGPLEQFLGGRQQEGKAMTHQRQEFRAAEVPVRRLLMG